MLSSNNSLKNTVLSDHTQLILCCFIVVLFDDPVRQVFHKQKAHDQLGLFQTHDFLYH